MKRILLKKIIIGFININIKKRKNLYIFYKNEIIAQIRFNVE